jgi:hypothetical protein
MLELWSKSRKPWLNQGFVGTYAKKSMHKALRRPLPSGMLHRSKTALGLDAVGFSARACESIRVVVARIQAVVVQSVFFAIEA